MTKNDIIRSLGVTAKLTEEQISKAITHKLNLLKEVYDGCYESVENGDKAMAKYCLYILCRIKF